MYACVCARVRVDVIDFVKANKNSGKLVERDERQLTKRCQLYKKKKKKYIQEETNRPK